MLMPALIPKELSAYSDANTDLELFQRLEKRPNELVHFFEIAAEDETWSEEHLSFMHLAIEWLTMRFRQEKLALTLASRVARSFQAHFSILRHSLVRDMTLSCLDGHVEGNSLFLSVNSEFFHDLIRLQYNEEERLFLDLSKISSEFIRNVEEFSVSGTVVGIWKQEPENLLNLLEYATTFRMSGLVALCEETYKRYINRENVLKILRRALNKSWINLRESCFLFLNQQRLGLKFEQIENTSFSDEERGINNLAIEFLEFSENALDIFRQLKELITHLVFSGDLTENSIFSQVVRECSRLKSVNISRTREFSERLYDLPSDLEELDLSKCPWLTNENLRKIIDICPHLSKIALSSNVQLTYQGWGELRKLSQLQGLNLSRCQQMHDEDMLILLRASPQLTQLNLEECTGLGERAFFEIARGLPQLAVFNAARTYIGDASLIEIASRCNHLRILNVTRCKGISDRGILQAIKLATSLQLLDVTGCHLSSATFSTIQKMRPKLIVKH